MIQPLNVGRSNIRFDKVGGDQWQNNAISNVGGRWPAADGRWPKPSGGGGGNRQSNKKQMKEGLIGSS